MLQPREYVDPSLVDPNSNAYDGLPESFKNKLDRGSRIVTDVIVYLFSCLIFVDIGDLDLVLELGISMERISRRLV
jgi:hypothetical protein